MLHILQNDPDVPPGNILEHLHLQPPVHHLYRGWLLYTFDAADE